MKGLYVTLKFGRFIHYFKVPLNGFTVTDEFSVEAECQELKEKSLWSKA